MCRLAYFPPKARINIKRMATFLEQLETSFGGDGNGYAAIAPDGTAIVQKSVKMATSAIARSIVPLIRQGYAVYFHTRKISIGWKSDEQCHPFYIDGPEFKGVLCHNGTWSEGGTLAKYLGTGSDTATFAYIIGELGLEKIDQRKLMPSHGVFLIYGSSPGETPTHNVLHLGGSLEYCPVTGIWASEFFKDWPHYAKAYCVETGAHSLDKQPPRSKFRTTSYSSYNYVNNSWNGGYTGQRHLPFTPNTTDDDQRAIQNYWPRQPVNRGDYEDLDPVEAMGVDNDFLEDRQFYHQRMEEL